MNKTNNVDKSNQRQLFPSDLQKCFFAIENEFQDFEKNFLIHHMERRSNFRFKDKDALKRIGIEWLIWYLEIIYDELKTPGQVLSTVIISKMNAALKNNNKCDLDVWERHKLNHYIHGLMLK